MRKAGCLLLLVSLYLGVSHLTREKAWIIEGIASTAGVKDFNNCRIESAALQQGVWALVVFDTVLFNHDFARPIGKLRSFKVSNDALYVTIEISHTEARLWRKIKDGTLTGLSVAADVVDDWPDCDDQGNIITTYKALRIYEVSVVSVPAAPLARITSWREE